VTDELLMKAFGCQVIVLIQLKKLTVKLIGATLCYYFYDPGRLYSALE